MQSKKILILDDEKEICFLLSAILRQMGYETDEAYSIVEASKKFIKHSYDLVFMDLNLPDGLGYHLIPMIKENNASSRIVMISAHDAMLKRLQNEIQEIDYCIFKPFNREKISEALQKLDMTNDHEQ